MKKYIIKFSFAMAISIFCLYFASKFLYVRLRMFDPEYGMWVAKNDIIKSCGGKDVVVVLGDSRIMAAYRPLPENNGNVVNLALGGGSPVEAYQILRRLINNSTHIKKLLISFVPGHFEAHDSFLGRPVLFGFFTDEEYAELSAYSAHGKLFKADMGDVKKCWYGLPTCYAPYFKYIFSPGRYGVNKKFYAEVMSSGGWHLFGTENPWGKPEEITREQFRPDPVLDMFFDKLIALAKSHSIPIAFYLTPLEKSSYESMRPAYRKGFVKYITGKYSGMAFFDGGPVSVDLMGDGSHVNLSGANFVTSSINETIFLSQL